MPLALLLLLLVGGGTTGIVAEKSLPGDVLYPVKIHINENFESAVAFTAKSDAEVSVKHAAKRLAEAQKLKDKGELSSEQSIELANSFKNEVKIINENVEKVRSKGDSESADKIDSDFEKDVKEYSEIVGILGVDDEDEDKNEDKKVESKVKSTNTAVKKEEHNDDDDDHEEMGDDKKVVTPTKTTPKTVTPPKTTTPTAPTVPVSTVAKYTMEQVSKHNTPTDCWSVVNGGVYNFTDLISVHPGGPYPIVSACGIDGTSKFLNEHGGQEMPAQELAKLKIGELQ